MKAFWIALAACLLAAASPAEEPAPRALGKSLKDQAGEALGKGERPRAIRLYEQWLQADPRDFASWYNLACLHALDGRKDKALEALECAVDAGWTDARHAQEDKGLESLREEPRFKAAVGRCGNASAAEGPQDCKRHFIRMESLGTYLVMLPPDYETSKRAYPVCLILHGNGSSDLRHGKVADRVGRQDVIFVAPRAPHPHEDVFLAMKQAGWTVAPRGLPEEQSGEAVTQYVGWNLACAEDARKRYRVAGEGIFILGHSMGAWMAHTIAIRNPEKVASFFAYAGGMWEGDRGNLAPLKARGVKVFLAQGMKEDEASVERMKRTAEWMKEAGVDCTFRTFDCDHGISPEVATFMKEWLDAEVRPRATKPDAPAEPRR